MMMQRLVAFARSHGRTSHTIPNPKFFFSNLLLRQSSSLSSTSSCHLLDSEDFQKTMNYLSNAAPNERGHEIYSSLDALDITTSLQHDQHFALDVIETSCETKLVQTPRVQPYNIIHFIKLVWKNNKDLITTHVLETLVSSICSTNVTPPTKNDLLFLWDLIKRIGRYDSSGGLLNAWILNTLLRSFSIMGHGEGKAALEVFNNFEVFQCVPNHDTYYFTLQALLSTKCSDDMIHQAASICQNMLLLLSHDLEYTHLPPSSLYDEEEDIYDDYVEVVLDEFQSDLSYLGSIPRPYLNGCVCVDLNLTDFNPLRQLLHHYVLKTIETSCQPELIETNMVSPHNLIHFVKWAWRRSNNNSDLITTPVLESLVSVICDGSTDLYDYNPRKNDILFLWDLLKDIGHCQTGLLNTQILNQLLDSFVFMSNQGKTALEVFHKFEVFQCEPNRDTYTFTLQAILYASRSTDMSHQAASICHNICQKMSLHPETLLPEDGKLLGYILSRLSQKNMIKDAYALYLAANEKRKKNPNWSRWLRLDMLLPLDMIKVLC